MRVAVVVVVALLAACLCSTTLAQCAQTVSVPVLFSKPVMDPASIPLWKTALVNPLDPSSIFVPDQKVTAFDSYRIGMRQIQQQMLPAGCPKTSVFAYGNADDPLDNPISYSSPSKTIVAVKGRPSKVDWIHTQMPTKHLLPIDRSFHCGSRAINCTPDVRTVTHLHGGHVEWQADGFPEAWQSAEGLNGTLFDGKPYTYINDQEATTMWFHDHAPGITRLNVYAGLAGFYILRGTRESALQALNQLPRAPYDIPIVIQDRFFYPDGSLAYPDMPFAGPARLTNVVFGNVFVVNGAAWPTMAVERRRYRIRLLNGCNERFLRLRFVSTAAANPSVLSVKQIGSDGGLLNSPVDLTGQAIILAPAERADLIINFGGAQVKEQFYLTNDAPAPYPYGASPAASDPMSKVILISASKPLNLNYPKALAPPSSLRNNPLSVPANLAGYLTRKIVFFDQVDTANMRLRKMLGTDLLGPLKFCDAQGITESPALGATEVWEIYNPTGDTHPMHLHLVQFQVIDRRNIVFPQSGSSGYSIGSTTYPVLPNEQGLKDTIRIEPNTVIRIIATFDKPGLYVHHCHMLAHEDFDMMRPLCVGGSCNTDWIDMSQH